MSTGLARSSGRSCSRATRRAGLRSGPRRCVYPSKWTSSLLVPNHMPPVVQIDIFSKDVILIPINHSNAHWTAAAINFRKKRIESYDSMGMARSEVFKLLRQYLDDEHRNKEVESLGAPFARFSPPLVLTAIHVSLLRATCPFAARTSVLAPSSPSTHVHPTTSPSDASSRRHVLSRPERRQRPRV